MRGGIEFYLSPFPFSGYRSFLNIGVGEIGNAWANGVMTNKKPDLREDVDFRMLRLIEKKPGVSQRDIAKDLGISLGAVNYCLHELIDRGYLKIDNFRRSRNKIKYIYVLTPSGISHRAKMAIKFLDRKIQEYNRLKVEIDEVKSIIDNKK